MTKEIVNTPSVFSIDDSFDDERFMKVRIAVMHSGENLNGSSFSTEVIRDAEDSFKNIGILANIIKTIDADGNTTLDYGGHDMHMEEDLFNEDSVRIIYDEKVVGFIPETNNFEIVFDESSGKDYVYVDGYIYREYGNYAADILEARGGRTSVSAEIYVDDMSVNAETKIVEVNKMRMSGVTLLGEDVNPAMKGANAAVFSKEDDNIQAQLIEVMKELKESLDNYTATISANSGNNNSEKGGAKDMDKFNELLEQYGKTVEDIMFEYEDLSDEELEAKFAEVFGESDPEPEPEQEPEQEENEPEPEEPEDQVTFTAEYKGRTVQMSVSLQDKIAALYELVNDTYADDDTWYDVQVYDDDKYVIMIDYWRGKGYKQSYKVKKDSYSLVGDRVEVYSQWLTQDEIKKLEDIRANYSVVVEKLSKYEDEPKKAEILNSDCYSSIANNEDFVELVNDHFDMSVEDVASRADEILLNAAKSNTFSVAVNTKKLNVKPIPAASKKTKRYGSLFDGIVK